MKSATQLYDSVPTEQQDDFLATEFEKGKLKCDGCGFVIENTYITSPANLRGKLLGRTAFLHIFPFQNLVCQVRTCSNCKKVMGKPTRICKNTNKLYIMEGQDICDTVLEDKDKICPKCFSKEYIKFDSVCVCGTANNQALRVKFE